VSAEIINLSKARKAREKEQAAKGAAQNRLKFGRTKAEKTLKKLQDEITVRRLDAARRNKDESKPEE
jgi:hypothetical protein